MIWGFHSDQNKDFGLLGRGSQYHMQLQDGWRMNFSPRLRTLWSAYEDVFAETDDQRPMSLNKCFFQLNDARPFTRIMQLFVQNSLL